MGNNQSTGHGVKKKKALSIHDQSHNIIIKENKFKIHIALDFGTDGCALAFAYNDTVTVYDKWMTKKRKRAVKAKTQILLNEKNDIVAFGDNAKIVYSSLTGQAKREWKFFERFKMELYDNSAGCDVYSKVFIQTFRHIQEIAMEYVDNITKADGEEHITDEYVQWIVTVPAIWKESAKKQMKQWMIEANIINPSIKDQCLIVFEPDCAALCIAEEYRKKQLSAAESDKITKHYIRKHNLKSVYGLEEICNLILRYVGIGNEFAESYMLIDAGGGTVDIVCHKVVDDGLEEIHYPMGSDWGGCEIDDNYMKWLKDVFGEKVVTDFQQKSPNHYAEIIDYFQSAKKKFYKKKKAAKKYAIQLPQEFMQHLQDNFDVKSLNIEYDYVELSDDGLIVGTAKWIQWFDALINKIISYVKDEQSSLNDILLGNDCGYMYLVGGLACSKYFQYKMKEIFESDPYNLKVMIPKNPILSVVIGAAYFGLRKNVMKARKLRYTYAVVLAVTEEVAIKRGVSRTHINNNRWYANYEIILDVLHVFASKNQRIEQDKPIKFGATRTMDKHATVTDIIVFVSNKEQPLITTDGTLLGTLSIPNKYFQHDKKIVIEFHLYDTIMEISAYPKSNPSAKEMLDLLM